MDWEQYFGYLHEALLSAQGLFAVFGTLLVAACGAAAVHVVLRSKPRSEWASVCVAVYGWGGFWLWFGIANLVLIDAESMYLRLPFVIRQVFEFFIVPLNFLIVPLAAVLISIRREYRCNWKETWYALAWYFIAGGITLWLLTLCAPNYLS